MNNSNQRYGGRGGYNHSYPRAQAPNNNIYALTRNIIPINTHNGYGYNSNTHNQFPPQLPPPPSSGRTNGYSNSNYVFTHRVQQQYSVQVVNPTEQQHLRQPIINNNTVGDHTFPQQQVSSRALPLPPRLNNNVEDIQLDSLANAVVPYTNAANGSASNIPASCTTPPKSCSANPTPAEVDSDGDNDDDDYDIMPELQVVTYHHKMVGEGIGKVAMFEKAKSKILKGYLLDIETLKAQVKELLSQLTTLEQEKDDQARNLGNLIIDEQREAARARQDYFTWRNNAMRLTEQLESLRGLLSGKDNQIKSLNSKLADAEREVSGCMQRLELLEQKEKDYLSEIHGKNDAIEQYKAEIQKKNDDLAKVGLRLKENRKEIKQLDDEMNTMTKELNMEVSKEKKRVIELEANITDLKNKYTAMKATADGYKADKEKLEGDKAKLENIVDEQNKSILQKDEEILQFTEELGSLQLKKKIADGMLKRQTDKTTDLQTEMEKQLERYSQLSTELNAEKEMKNHILQEHMDFYTRPTLLNQLIQQKMQTSQLTFVASEVGQQPRLNSPGCSSPVASEEVPESVSSERDCGDERLEHGHVETPETGRKRKHSTNSNGPNYGVRQKDLKISGDSVVPIEQRDKKVETGSSQMKDQEGGGTHKLRVSSRRSSHGTVSTSTNTYVPFPAPVSQEVRSAKIPSSSANGAPRRDKVRKNGNQEASIRIKIANPSINFKKSK